MKNTLDFDFTRGDFNMKNGSPVILSGVAALRKWIEKALRTQLGRYKMYNGYQYGANIEDLVIGKTYGIDFIKAELKREIETALLQNEDIYSVSGFSISRTSSAMTVSFNLDTAYGTVTEEYTYDY